MQSKIKRKKIEPYDKQQTLSNEMIWEWDKELVICGCKNCLAHLARIQPQNAPPPPPHKPIKYYFLWFCSHTHNVHCGYK